VAETPLKRQVLLPRAAELVARPAVARILVGAGLAGIVGLIDFIGVPRVRTLRAGWAHLLLNVAILGLAVVNLLLRRVNVMADIVPSGLILSIIATGLLLVSAWFGGEMVYRHKVGVTDR
jgi:uncharacterized membrane protein